MYKNIRANFWKCLFANLIEIILFIILAITLAFLKLAFSSKQALTIFFYSYFVILIIILLTLETLIPLFCKGYNLGRKILKIKLVINDSTTLFRVIVKREIFSSYVWIVALIIYMVSFDYKFNPATIQNIKTAPLEIKIPFAIISSIIYFSFMIQIFSLIMLFKKERKSLIDIISKSELVEASLFIIINNKNILSKTRQLKPVIFTN